MIYFIQPIDGGPIKIGRTNYIQRRFSELQNAASQELKILGVTEGHAKEEYDLHLLFSSAKLHGEWFEPIPELVEYISAKTEPYYPRKSPSSSPFLSASEVADEFGVSLRTVNRWIKSGYFPGAIRRNPRVYNSTYIIPKDAVEKFKLERQATQEN